MKLKKILINFTTFFFLSTSIYSQTLVQKEVVCPSSMVELVNKSKPGFYFDKEYVKTIKYNDNFNFHLLIKVPNKISEAKYIENIKRVPAPPGVKLISFNYSEIIDSPKNITLTFNNRQYKPGEIICIKIDGKATEKGNFNPNLIIKGNVNAFGYKLSREIIWNGINLNIK